MSKTSKKLITVSAMSIGIFLLAEMLVVAGSFLSGCQSQPAGDHQAEVLEDILQNRRSVRQYSDREVTDETLLKILWAANGVNREDGRHTAPSAINAQDIELYVCRGEGTWHYLPKERQLAKVSDTDVRPFIVGHNKYHPIGYPASMPER